jgi:WD40 repeat protein
VRIWDLGSGQELLNLRGHTAPVWSVVFSPDGRWLISAEAASKGLFRLWDAPPAEEPR